MSLPGVIPWVRLQQEERKEWWWAAWERWKEGDTVGLTQGDIKSFIAGGEYCEGPYWQWIGYKDPREGLAGGSEAWDGPQEEWKDSTGGSNAWNGSMGESEGWEDSAGEGEAWNSPQRGGAVDEPIDEPTDEPVEERQLTDEPIDQYCSSCNQKKPLIDFGRFLTCVACQWRNTKANRRWASSPGPAG
jgi:hypothetical protein